MVAAIKTVFCCRFAGWLLLFWLLVWPASAQRLPLFYSTLYRPPGITYQILKSPHFDVIFEAGAEKEAQEGVAILESQMSAAQALTGSRTPFRMPVVINQFNDRSNGFVAPLPFRQEIEAVGIKSSGLSARFSSWMWTVAPHELVHAAQATFGQGIGAGRILQVIAPDLVRSLNLGIPPGMTEGAAVYHESNIQAGAGRLHHSLFNMQFRAAMMSGRGWSLAQMLETSAYTWPVGRHYIGGAHFFQYLADKDNAQFFRHAMDFHYRFPFLGHGIELWYAAKASPARLGRSFRQEVRAQEQARQDALKPFTYGHRVAHAPGRSHRRPQWLNDSTLVAYITGYDTRPGFYRVDTHTGAAALMSHQVLPEDVFFSLNKTRQSLLFSRYVRDMFVTTQWIADVFRVNIETGETTRLTDGARIHAPVDASSGVWGLQNRGQFNAWVHVDSEVTPVIVPPRTTFVQLAMSPTDNTVVVLARQEGRQGLFRAFPEEGREMEPWIFFRDASVYDVSWSADGQYLLFSADPGGVTNVYACHVSTGRLMRLTNVPFGAREGSLSPDGRTLAYAEYRHERYDLLRVPFVPEEAYVVDRAVLEEPRKGSTEVEAVGDMDTYPYRAGSFLAPRMLLPVVRSTDPDPGVGLMLQGGDPLQQWAYGAEGFYQGRRLWGRVTIATSLLRVQPSLTVFNMPIVVRDGDRGVRQVRGGERGAVLGLRMPMALETNVHTTAIVPLLQVAGEEERIFSSGLQQRSLTLRPGVYAAYRLQANRRDLIPNMGTTLWLQAETDLWQQGGRHRQNLYALLTQYVSLSLKRHTGVRTRVAWFSRNQDFVYSRGWPRGYDDIVLRAGSFWDIDVEIMQPLWFIDDGFFLVPLYMKALYGYGFAGGVLSSDTHYSSVGAGLGLQMRLFYFVDLNLRFGASYLIEEGRFVWTLGDGLLTGLGNTDCGCRFQ